MVGKYRSRSAPCRPELDPMVWARPSEAMGTCRTHMEGLRMAIPASHLLNLVQGNEAWRTVS